MSAILTYEGLTGLLTRTTMAVTADLPYLYTKFTMSSRECIQGEAVGKMLQLLLDYSI